MNFNNVVCPACRKQVVEPINLICSHHLCYRCAQKIIVQETSSFQKKYKIQCPACRKSTITYDLRHLIISETEYDEDLFVTTKYLNQKAEVRACSPEYVKDHDNIEMLIAKYHQGKKSSSMSKEKNVQQYSMCPTHPNNYVKYFCEKDKLVLCVDCLRLHKDHDLDDIMNYQDVIASNTLRFKQELKSKTNQLKKNILSGNEQKKSTLHQLETLQKTLDHEFNILKLQIERKHEQLNKKLKDIYYTKIQQQSSYLQDLTSALKFINQFSSVQLPDFPSQVKFYSIYTSKFKTFKLDIQVPPKNPSFIWDKDIDGIDQGLQRFMKLKQVTLTSSHQRHRSGNHSNLSHGVSVLMQVHRKGSLIQDQILCRPSIQKSKQNKQSDGKRFKF